MKSRKLLVYLLTAVMVVASSLFAFSCKKEEGFKSHGEEDVYYAEAGESEYTLELKKGVITLKADVTKTGTYSFDGTLFTYKFDGETLTADYKVNTITLSENGVNRIYCRRSVNYSVTYYVNGDTFKTQSVVNGKKAVKPENPVKEGFVFVGWYSDEGFKSLYNFNTMVTGDKSVYARFTEATADNREYTVTFYDGNVETERKKTQGGKLFGVENPVTEGKSFLGWYLSDYQDKNKLTRKYSEDYVFDSDADLYSVYKEDVDVAVSVTSDKIEWTKSGVSSYSVSLTMPDGSTKLLGTTGATYHNYDFKSAAAGDYVVTVTAGSKEYKAYYKNKALARVCDFKVVGNAITFAPVSGAERYYITVKCGNANHAHTKKDIGTDSSFDFSDCVMTEKGIEFIVEASANGYATSVSDPYTLIRNLGPVTVAADAETDVISWNAVENAVNYVITVTAGGEPETYNAGIATEFSLKKYAAGEITVNVKATAKGYNSSFSEIKYVKAHLSTPENVKISGKTLSFDSVVGATGYVVKIGNAEKTADASITDRVTVSLESELSAAGVYAVSVKAKGATADKDSAYSEEIKVISGATVETAAAVYEKGKVEWTSVADAVKYVVKLNGETVQTVEDGSFSAPVTFKRSGENAIEVFYVTEGGSETALASVKVTVYEISFNAEGGNDVDPVYKAAYDDVVYPVTAKKGYSFSGWFNAPGGLSGTGSEYVNGVFCDKADVTLYAYWTAKTYKIKLHYGEAGDDEEAVVTYNREYSLPAEKNSPDATKNFLGWFSLSDGAGTRYTNELGDSLAAWDYDEDGRDFYAAWVVAFTFNEIDNGNAYSVSKATTADYFSVLTIPVSYNDKFVTTVEGSAFRSCSLLETVNIPDTVKTIEIGTAFLSCSSLENVNIYETEEREKGAFSSVGGVLLYDNEYNGKELKYFPQARRGEYEIPDGVETIPVAAFKTSKISKVTIPASVTTIDANAFLVSANLTEVVFAHSDGGEELTIGASAFGSCKALTSITLPARLKSFSSEIFKSSYSLVNVNIDGESADYSSIDGVLCNGDGSQIIYFPIGRTGAYTIPSGVSVIGEEAFKDCYYINSVTIPGYVTEIGKGAFSDCRNIISLTFGGVKGDADLIIGEQAFYGCYNIKKLTLPENLTELKKNSFGNTQSLTEVTLDCGNASFENAAFGTIVSAADAKKGVLPKYYVTTLNIGKDLGIIDINGVFGGTTLKTVTIDKANTNYTVRENVIYDYNVTKIVYYPMGEAENYVIPSTVVEIGANVFESKQLKKITLSENIATIGDNAFLNCKNLTEITFKPSDKELSIGNNAFKGTAITSITLPSRVKTLGERAFASCDKLETAVIAAQGVTEIKAETFKGCSALKSVTLPEGITVIGNGAFASCAALTEINIPASVTTLQKDGSGALSVFALSNKLATVTIAEGNVNYASSEGVIYEKDENGALATLVYCPIANNVKDGKFTVPAAVKRIETGAFASNAVVTEIKFGGGGENLIFGKNVFDGCAKLSRMVLPSGLTEISESLFENCSSLEYVYVPNTVNSIKKGAFHTCVKLSTVEFEDNGVKDLVIEDGEQKSMDIKGAFSGCEALNSISLPARTVKIGAYAFTVSNMNTGVSKTKKSGLTSIVIPAHVKTIGNYAFYCVGTKVKPCVSLTFDDINNSQLETIGKNAFTALVAYGFAGTSVTLPSSVKSIGESAFSGCAKIKTFNINDIKNSRLETIGKAAFSGCSALTEFVVPAQVKTIGAKAFSKAAKLTSVTFEEGSALSSVSEMAFQMTGLTEFTFPATEESITLGKNLFDGCKNLTTVHISKSVTNVADALDNCASITTIAVNAANPNVKVENSILFSINSKDVYYLLGIGEDGVLNIPEGVETIDSYSLSGKLALKEVHIPSSVRMIGDYAFSGSANIGKITFAENSELQSVGKYAFKGCGITSINLPLQLAKIGDYAFNDCAKLTSVDMKDGVTTFGKYMFSGCSSLTSFTFPVGVTELPEYTFEDCTSLTSVAYRGIVSKINEACFKGCTALESIEIPDSVTVLGNDKIMSSGYINGKGSVFEGCSKLSYVKLPKNLTAIAPSMFKGCSLLETLEIPDSVKAIGISAFENCSKINNLVIPEGVKIGYMSSNTSNNYVFRNCSSLANIEFKGELGFIGKECFAGCTSLKTMNVQGKGGLIVRGVTGFGHKAFKGSGLETVNLPETLKSIYIGSFADCVSLKSITIPANVTSIGGGVFTGCTNLSRIAIDERNVVYRSDEQNIIFSISGEIVYCPTSITGEVVLKEGETLGRNAFENCAGITKVTLPAGVTEIPDKAFNGCTALTEINVPDGVTYIGDFAFKDCVSLKKINIPEGMSYLGDSAFAGCTSLTEVVIPDVKSIGMQTFSGCTALTAATVKCKSVMSGMFNGCASLKTVILSEGVTSIEGTAFKDCVALTEITLPSSVTKVSVGAFNGCTITVTVPYKSASDIPEGLLPLTTAAGVTVVYKPAV